MSWLDRLRGGFSKTAEKVADNLTGLTSRAALDTSTLDDIEEALIASDLGPEASHRIREAIARQKFERLDERGLRSILAEEIEKILAPVAKPLEVWGFPRPHVILVIGVNGSGKTTTIGKLGHWLKEQDYGVLLAAGDTFRAAAIEQLQIWGDRIGAPVITGKEGGDAAGIVFDGVKQATATGIDALIVDTAGRLQNKSHLMEELSKIRRVLGRLNPEAPHDVLLVLDATTGQNALAQVEVFRENGGRDGAHHDQAGRHGARRRAGRRGREVRASDPRHRRRREGRRPPSLRSARRRAGHRRIAAGMSEAKPEAGSSWTMLLDYGPLIVFFVDLQARRSGLQGSLVATFAFMVAVIISIAVGLAVVKRVSPMVWVSTVLILGFGAITLYLRDPKFIQMKPTVIYIGFAALLGIGLLRGKALLQVAVRPGLPGTDRRRLAEAEPQLGPVLPRPRRRQRSDARDADASTPG